MLRHCDICGKTGGRVDLADVDGELVAGHPDCVRGFLFGYRYAPIALGIALGLLVSLAMQLAGVTPLLFR